MPSQPEPSSGAVESQLQSSSGRDLIAVFVYNEGLRVEKVLTKLSELQLDCDVVVIDDGSDDESPAIISHFPFPVLRHPQNLGAGAAMKAVFRYGIERGNRFIVLIAGNGKMDPAQIPSLLEPIRAGQCDYVQGSRYLSGGRHENVPLFRHVMIKLVTWAVAVLTGFKGTDVTCGFRAYPLSLTQNPEIDVWQSWLDRYELEYYIHYKVIKLGYRVREISVSMLYPKDGRPYSKIKPFVGWWSMLRPWVLLSLRIRH